MGAAANVAAAQKAAAAGTRAAGKALSSATSRAKTPLIAGGAAAVGLVGGMALFKRARSHEPGMVESIRAAVSGRDGTLDLDVIVEAARRIGSVGDQVAAVADAVQKSRDGK